MRTKALNLDGEEFLICPLSLAQTMRMLDRNKEIKIADVSKPTDAEGDAVFSTMHQIVCDGLNNARRSEAKRSGMPTPDRDDWTIEKIREEMDSRTMVALHMAILEFSDLTVDKAPLAGEVRARATGGESASGPSIGTK